MWHPDEGSIHAWLDGALDAAEAARVEAHVASCADCAPVVAEARALIGGSSRVVASLDYEPGGVASRPVVIGTPPRASGAGAGSAWRRLHLSPALAAAAAVVIVAAGTWFTLSQREASMRATERVATASSAAAGSDSAAVAMDSVRRAYEEARRRAEEMRVGAAGSSQPAARANAGVVAAAPPTRSRSADEPQPAAAGAENAERADVARMAKAQSAAAPAAMQFALGDAARAAGCYALPATDQARFTALPPRFTLDTALVQLGPKSSGERHYTVRTEPVIAGSYWTLNGTTVSVVFGATKSALSFALPGDAKSPVHANVSGGGALSLGRC